MQCILDIQKISFYEQNFKEEQKNFLKKRSKVFHL